MYVSGDQSSYLVRRHAFASSAQDIAFYNNETGAYSMTPVEWDRWIQSIEYYDSMLS